LNLQVPKPSFANARTRSAFGFQAATIPETDHAQLAAQDSEHQDRNMVADEDGSADVMDEFGEDLYTTDAEGRIVDVNEVVGHGSGMIHSLSFNTLTMTHFPFART
jgi:hypothetical protein